MKRAFAMAFILVFALMIPAGADEETIQGFTRTSSPIEHDWEIRFRSIPAPANERDYMKRLSARPHHVGSPYDKDNAEWILSQVQGVGTGRAHRNFRRSLSVRPRNALLEMVEPTKFTAKLQEPARGRRSHVESAEPNSFPPTTPTPIDGDVTAPLVYVNYGVPDDYEAARPPGRFGEGRDRDRALRRVWRGMKPKVAAEHGAVGCIIYSDPHDDGYFDGDVFPQGPMRPPTACSAAA